MYMLDLRIAQVDCQAACHMNMAHTLMTSIHKRHAKKPLL